MAFDIGVDVGSVSVNVVVIDDHEKIVWEAPYVRHFGQVVYEVRRVLEEVFARFGATQVRSVTFTGVHGERLAEILNAPFEVETIAQVTGALHVAPDVRSIISIGGQDASLFQVSHRNGSWHLDAFNMNGPCASGTGSFMDQQSARLASSIYGAEFEMTQEKMQKTLQDFISLGLQHSSPAPVACRCTVFTKSDMIHLQNKGEPLPNIIAGLHYGNAANYVSTIVAARKLEEPVIFIGGMASNPLQLEAFRQYYPNLQVPAHHTSLGALGAALQSRRAGRCHRVDLQRLSENVEVSGEEFPRAPRLELRWTVFDVNDALPSWEGWDEKNPVPVYLGVDIGSTTTKYALIDESGRICHKCYVQTQGKPIEVTQNLLRTMLSDVGSRVRIKAVATTGSGRNVVGDFLHADLILDEITAHAKGAVAVDATVDTIFEIGGQDSKYIRLEDTHPLDFDMNKVCAAGTGSFLHELANKLKINIVGEFQELALASQSPVSLAERCTVFMESDLFSYLQKGARREDLIAGLCYAVVHNYLNRVVGKRPIGKKIMFLGGPSLNKAVVAAFERVLQRPLVVPPHREVMGAYGAALAVKEAFEKGEVSEKQRDFQALAQAKVQFTESVCRADKHCHNECKLKIYDFVGRKSVWGGDCGRFEVSHYRGPSAENIFEARQRLFWEMIREYAHVLGEPVEASSNEEDRPVVGVPVGLHALEWGPFWVRLLAALGCRVLVSPKTDNRIALKGVESMTAETCFPVKVFHGHVDVLLDHVDYVFLPNVITMPVTGSQEAGMFCPLVQSSQYVVRAALNISDDRLIRPTLFMKQGPEAMISSVYEALPRSWKLNRDRVAAAVRAAWGYQQWFRKRVYDLGHAILSRVPALEPVWIVTGRPYNLYDERLNLRLGRHLAKLGIWAIPADLLDVDREDLSDFPRMYWGLGARILKSAKRIARTPHWFGVHLSNFSCGPDSFIEHFYRHILERKPALILELDEHSAVAGLLTRVEAFRNVVKNVHETSLGSADWDDLAGKLSN